MPLAGDLAATLAGVFVDNFTGVLPDLEARDLVAGLAERADFPPDAVFFDAAFATAEPRSLRTELPTFSTADATATLAEKIGKYSQGQWLRSSKR